MNFETLIMLTEDQAISVRSRESSVAEDWDTKTHWVEHHYLRTTITFLDQVIKPNGKRILN